MDSIPRCLPCMRLSGLAPPWASKSLWVAMTKSRSGHLLVLRSNRNVFLTVTEAGGVTSGYRRGHVLGRALSRCGQAAPVVSSHGGKRDGELS